MFVLSIAKEFECGGYCTISVTYCDLIDKFIVLLPNLLLFFSLTALSASSGDENATKAFPVNLPSCLNSIETSLSGSTYCEYVQ